MKLVHLSRSTLVIVSLLSLPVKAIPYYVNGTCGSDTCNGQYAACWSQGVSNCAKKTIQAGINATQLNGDVVNVAPMVAPATYSDLGNRDLTFPPAGGFARAIIVQCEVRGECTIDCEGTAQNDHRGFRFDDDDPNPLNNPTVDGFRIINGYVDSGNPSGGGAIAVSQASPTIQYCIIEDNKADSGGGIYLVDVDFPPGDDSVPKIIGCVIRNNEALTLDGGGVYLAQHTDADIDRCRITGNKATNGWGGGIAWSGGSDVRVTDTEISENEAKRSGGGVWVQGKDERERSSWLKRCTIRRNKVTGGVGITAGGGGITAAGVGLVFHIVNCLIEGNRSMETNSKGGGLFIDGPQNNEDPDVGVRFVNSKVVGNTAAEGAGVLVSLSPGPATTFEDCTIANNEASTIGGGIRWGSAPTGTPVVPVQNLIAWENTPEQLSEQTAGMLDVDYSDIQGTWPGTGNINSNPLFVRTPSKGADGQWGTNDDDYGDLRILSNSPCINVGNSTLLPSDGADIDEDDVFNEALPLDLDLFDRVVSTQVDMGAYEIDGCTSNDDCDDANQCNGTETCSNGHCITTLIDCNLNGISDFCDIYVDFTSQDCDANGVPDDEVCQPGEQVAVLILAVPAHEHSLWRDQKNIMRFTFACDVGTPSAGQVPFQEMLSAGAFGSDLSSGFTFVIENDASANPRILRIKETASTLLHRKWYAVRNTGSWSGVANFEVQYVVQRGDANDDGRVLNGDVGLINTHVGESQPDDSRYDIDGDGDTDSTDVNLANSYVPSLTVNEPSGHEPP